MDTRRGFQVGGFADFWESLVGDLARVDEATPLAISYEITVLSDPLEKCGQNFKMCGPENQNMRPINKKYADFLHI
jgi:hypothetical protein